MCHGTAHRPNERKDSKVQYASLNRTIEHLNKTSAQGLDFVRLDLALMHLVVLSGASFANATNLKSQVGYVILIANKLRCANVVHYASSRYHRESRSMIASEVHALLHALDMGMVIRKKLENCYIETWR